MGAEVGQGADRNRAATGGSRVDAKGIGPSAPGTCASADVTRATTVCSRVAGEVTGFTTDGNRAATEPAFARSLVDILNDGMAKLTESQKKLAAMFHQRPDVLAFEPAARIGKRVGVSEATVHRTAAKLGFSSFSELQRYAQGQFANDRTVRRLGKLSREVESDAQLIEDSFQRDILNLENTRQLNPTESLVKGASILAEARRIYVAGWRAGLYVTAGLSYTLDLMLGNTVMLPMHAGLHEAMRFMEPGDALIAAGLPRYCDVTLDVVTKAHSLGLSTITITDSISSPFVSVSSIAYFVSTYSVGVLDSYAGAVSIANALVAIVGRMRESDVEQNLKRIERILFPTKEDIAR